jgi:alpha-L-fucosidase
MSFAAASSLLLLLPSAKAAEPTDWFHDAKWGVMTHYLGAPPSSKGGAELTAEAWNKQVDGFDVNGFAEQLASTGAKYLLFTIGQNSGHYCSPNATYDRIVGITPSKCSRRDLIVDLAKALSARNIRLMVYLPSGAPGADLVACKKLGWRWGKPGGWQLPGESVGGRLAEFQRNWDAVVREWSLRWGKSVSGWWIDGCYFADQMYRFDDEPNFASFARAMKAGNPEAIVAFNPGVRVPVIGHTKFDNYTAGEVNLQQLSKAIESCPGRWLECEGRKVQFHILSFLGKSWCRGDRPQLPNDQLITCTRQIAAKGGVVTYDVPIQKGGIIPQPFIEQLRAIGAAMAEKPTVRADTRQAYEVSEDAQSVHIETAELAAANSSEAMFLRIDMPGHIRHNKGDTFSEIYLSYRGRIPASEFLTDFPPDARFDYRRDRDPVPERFIRGYRLRDPATGKEGPWLIGMTLEPSVVWEAWCHQRGYVCMIEEFGGRPIRPG